MIYHNEPLLMKAFNGKQRFKKTKATPKMGKCHSHLELRTGMSEFMPKLMIAKGNSSQTLLRVSEV